jgi:ferredoxin-type protein NapG
LADIDAGLDYGTPYIDIREQSCDFSCDSLQCVETCPTAVLNFEQFKVKGEEAIAKYDKEMAGKQMAKDYNPFKVQIVAMKEHVKMGMAELVTTSCLAFQNKGFTGTSREDSFKGVNRSPYTNDRKATPVIDKKYESQVCDICVKECPIGESAIVMEEIKNSNGTIIQRPKVLDGCTGCGVCTMVCPTEEPSIIVEPIKA